jgi:hypothetical protein
MTKYLISFGAHAMDHLADEDMAAVGNPKHEANTSNRYQDAA